MIFNPHLHPPLCQLLQLLKLLLPLLLFPLIVPALLASVKATSLIVLGDPMEALQSWLTLLVAFDAIYWALCGLLYGRVVEE